MKLDTEQDRQVLLDLIGKATVPGSAVFVIADLVQRIQGAEVESEAKPISDESGQSAEFGVNG